MSAAALVAGADERVGSNRNQSNDFESTVACAGLLEDLVARATGVAVGVQSPRVVSPDLSPSTLRRIIESEQHALNLARASGWCEDSRRGAALQFLADTLTSLAVDGVLRPGEARAVVRRAAAQIGVSPGAAELGVFMRALSGRDAAQLPPRLAAELVVWLLAELGPAAGASLWTVKASGRTTCVASAGRAPQSRRLRLAARAILAGLENEPGSHVRGVAVERWDRPYAALVARVRPHTAARLSVYLREAASALSPLFEREMLFDRNAARERTLVSATERRLLRLGYDLHDGPLQELVALADDLRLARGQVDALLQEADRARVRGRFADLEARLGELDRGLREIAHSVRSTNAVEQPLEHALQREVEALTRRSEIDAELAIEGDLTELTDSQRIALFRVAQESLSNVRAHSGATRTRLRLTGAPGHVSLTVSDNGRGFDLAEAVERARRRNRLGLAGICERIRLLGGDVEIDSRPGYGTSLRATLPRWSPIHPVASPVYAVTT